MTQKQALPSFDWLCSSSATPIFGPPSPILALFGARSFSELARNWVCLAHVAPRNWVCLAHLASPPPPGPARQTPGVPTRTECACRRSLSLRFAICGHPCAIRHAIRTTVQIFHRYNTSPPVSRQVKSRRRPTLSFVGGEFRGDGLCRAPRGRSHFRSRTRCNSAIKGGRSSWIMSQRISRSTLS